MPAAAQGLVPVLLLCLWAALWGAAGAAAAQVRLQTFEHDSLTIRTADGRSHRFEVEVAVTPEQHAQGLMFRRDLDASAGMLFLYERERPLSMWMMNTFIPLDMLFIKRDGRIVRVVERTVPRSLETISAGEPVAGVLEVNAGTASRLGIKPGDRIVYRAFRGAP